MLSAPLRRVAILACALTALLALGAGAAQATIYEPNRFGDPLIGGTSCTPPAPPEGCSLRGAIIAAEQGDTVKLAAGTYTLSFGSLDVEEKITIEGAGPTATTIEQTALDRVIEVDKGLTISGLTVTGGHLIGQAGPPGDTAGEVGGAGEGVSGAGIEGGGAMVISDVVVTGNVAFGGKGGNGASGTSGGTANGGDGGRGGAASGVGIAGGNPLVLLRVAVTGNTGTAGDGGTGGSAGTAGTGGKGGASGSSYGAGVSTGASAVKITDSLIAGNTSKAGTGGIGGGSGGVGLPGVGGQGEAGGSVGFFTNGTAKLTNVTITGNLGIGGTGGRGGNASGPAPVTGGKGGSGFGGAGGGIGLYNGAKATLASVTLAGNTVTAGTPGEGGNGPSGPGAKGSSVGTRGGNLFVTSAAAELRGTIVANGSADTGDEDCTLQSKSTLASLGHNLIDKADQCIETPAVGDLFGVPAGLGPLADNGGPTQTMALLTGSAAIDAGGFPCIGADGQPLSTDQRGLPRGNPCDIGAFEVQPAPPPPPPVPTTAALSKLKLAPKKLRNGQKATITFALDLGAKVSFELQRKLKPKKGKPKWVKVKKGAPKAFSAAAGSAKRTWKPHNLLPGSYRLLATPAGGKAAVFAFKILAPKRR